jgi:putative hydroxymethylpyrimidine transport system substrate-binding protein
MLGGFRNVEGVDLQMRGKDPVVTPVDQLGVPTYDELVLVANRERLEEDPEPYRLFLAALARGTAAAVKSPAATVDALVAANGDLDAKLTRAEVDATLPLLSADGKMNSSEWAAFIAWMNENELISSQPAPSQVLSNAYLPGKISE